MDNLIRLFTTLHVWVFQLSNGHIGNKLGKQSMLLLHTIGRKSGKDHFTTLSYYRDGENYLLGASNWGKEDQPDWFYNLIQQHHATIQVRTSKIEVDARQADGDEYKRLWQLVTKRNGQYVDYQKDMQRQIPIIVLTPSDQI